MRFAQALLTVEPGRWEAPLLVGMARLLNVFVRDPFVSLIALSIAGSVAGAVFIGLAAARLLGNAWTGAAVATTALLCPALLVFGPMPNAESLTIAFAGAMFFFFVERKPELFAVAAAAVIGMRLQLLLPVVAMLLIGCFTMAARGRMLATFGAACAVVLLPLFDPGSLGTSVRMQPELLVRFAAHPWGGKFLSAPLLAAAAAGVVISARKYRTPDVAALAAFGAISIAIALVTGSSIQGVQPMLAAIVPAAFFAVAAFARWPALAAGLAACFAAASLAYAWPAVVERSRVEAPAVAAMRHVSKASSGKAVVVTAPDLTRFGSVAAEEIDVVTPERLGEFVSRDDVDLFLLVHGRSTAAGAIAFGAPGGDVRNKLTSARFHLVSLVPQPAAMRYGTAAGVYEMESSPERAEWRWLAKEAVIELPSLSAGSVSLRFRLPEDAPLPSNEVTVGGKRISVGRGATAEITVPSTSRLTLRADHTFAPGDGRDLSVQLVGLQQW